jgi:hypothetical protein
MIPDSVDISSRVSSNLSALIDARLKDPDAEQPVTLAAVRDYLAGLLPASLEETEKLHNFAIDTSLLEELDTLIEQYGGDVLADDFADNSASEALSRVIDAVINDGNREDTPTLATVRDAIASGLTAKLVGDGAFDEDEDDTLLAETEKLIQRFGEDAVAERFLRYE